MRCSKTAGYDSAPFERTVTSLLLSSFGRYLKHYQEHALTTMKEQGCHAWRFVEEARRGSTRSMRSLARVIGAHAHHSPRCSPGADLPAWLWRLVPQEESPERRGKRPFCVTAHRGMVDTQKSCTAAALPPPAVRKLSQPLRQLLYCIAKRTPGVAMPLPTRGPELKSVACHAVWHRSE